MIKFVNPTLVTLTAPTCSGKSYLLDALADRGIFSRIVSTTTRAKRPAETEGVDYFFIDAATSLAMEKADEFFELIEFNGTRYGVTHQEMQAKMAGSSAPAVVLEPQGLAIYEKKCRERGWDIFKIYVHTTEEVRVQRLLQRGLTDLWQVIDAISVPSMSTTRAAQYIQEVGGEVAKQRVARILSEQHRRLLSITGEERRWSNVSTWDAIVPGDNLEQAIEMVQQGVKWRNRLTSPPIATTAVELPLR